MNLVRWKMNIRLIPLLAFLILAACRAAPLPAPSATAPATLTPLPPTLTASPTSAPSPLPSVTALPTLTPTPAIGLCAPLQGYAMEDLAGMIANPYHPPSPGLDDPHHGVDLAVMQPDTRMALAGHTVTAALAGRVAAILVDRFPYGNAVMIETPLEFAPFAWQALAGIPTPAPTLAPHSALTCPALETPIAWDESRRSLYVLYAHLQSAPEAQPGQQVTCGQALGQVGDSGNALNPHLHFEVRVGPSGAQPGSMAHYDASASPREMAVYCLWRVSGRFQLVDPMALLSAQP